MANKSYIGVDKIYYALVTTDNASAYAAGTPAVFAPAMNVSQAPKTNSKVQYADNQPFDTMSSEGETEMELEITGLPLDIQATILGKVWDATNKRMYDYGGTPPDIALGFRAKKSGGTYRYFWFLKGKFSAPTEESATETDSPDPKSTKLKFTAIATIYQFDLDGSINAATKRVVGDTDESTFDANTWFANVQVPAPGTPSALTCTPAPVDGATGQTTTVAITLTFNNALAAHAENGIVLTRVSTGAIIATTRTINAARTVVTLAHSALTSGAQYFITVPGVSDIYGQALADAVYDFTVA